MHVFRRRFTLKKPLRFLSGRKGPIIPGVLLAALLVAIAVPALYLALQPGGAVEGRPSTDSHWPKVMLGNVPTDIAEGADIVVPVKVVGDYVDDRCYGSAPAETPTPTPTTEPHPNRCIEGGIIVFDSHNDAEKGTFADALIAFKFRGNEKLKSPTYRVPDDGCKTAGRTIRIALNGAFDSATYGYTINGSEIDNE